MRFSAPLSLGLKMRTLGFWGAILLFMSLMSCRTSAKKSSEKSGASTPSALSVEVVEATDLLAATQHPLSATVRDITLICDQGQKIYPVKLSNTSKFEIARDIDGCNAQIDTFAIKNESGTETVYDRGRLSQDSRNGMWFEFTPRSNEPSGSRFVEYQKLVAKRVCAGTCVFREYAARFIVISIEGSRVALKSIKIIEKPGDNPAQLPAQSPGKGPNQSPVQSK